MIIQIMACTGKGKSLMARKIAEILKENLDISGADVIIDDEEISSAREEKMMQNFSNIIKQLRSNGQKIIIKTVQLNRLSKSQKV